MCKRFGLILLAAFCGTAHAAATLQSFSVTTQSSTDVLVDIGAQSSRSVGSGAAWPVTVNAGLLGSEPSSVALNLPDRASATLIRMRFEQRGPGFLWTGKGDGCVVVFSAERGGFHGVISCLNANYGIDPAGSSLMLTRYDSTPGATEAAWEGQGPVFTPPKVPSGNSPSTPTQIDTNIDILVLYTQAVRNYLTSVGDDPVSFIRRCVDTTQAALDASTATGQPSIATVNLAAVKFVTRSENNDDFPGDLIWMNDANGEVAKLRKFWAADVVIYLTEDTGSIYGLSNQPKANGYPQPGSDFAPFASSVLMRSHAINDNTGGSINQPYVFMHEFAHTLGADHDKGNAVNPNNPVEDWSFGHYTTIATQEPGNRTIMSYKVTPPCTDPCARILYYSNSQVVVDGFRTGVANLAENARTIADYGPTAAQYQLNLTRIFYDGFEP